MIHIEEIPTERMEDFWAEHIRYLVEDGIVTNEAEKAYFQSDEYRQLIREHTLRETDRHHLVHFVEVGQRVGAASYCTYKSEDGKCFILDFWVFPAYRGHGNGHRCFDALRAYAEADGALYYEINCDGRADRIRFWHSNGFADNGVDEYDMPLLIRQA